MTGLKIYGGVFDLEAQLLRLQDLEKFLSDPEVYDDIEKIQRIGREKKAIEQQRDTFERLESDIGSSLELIDIAIKEEDTSITEELCRFLPAIDRTLSTFEINSLLSGRDDGKNAIVSIAAGAGGTDAMDFADMLLRMYVRFAEENGYEIELLDQQEGEEDGIRSATILVMGENAFGYLKMERGVHRLVRISPYDTNKKRHTSFVGVAVYPEIGDDLLVEINENDLKIDTYKASGKGGQHINKTDSAVRITHIPSGIVVQCQNERSQYKNKATAMKILRSKLYDIKQIEQKEKLKSYDADRKGTTFGSQIRSYVLHPYQMIKDHRTGLEIGNVQSVLDGKIFPFIQKALMAEVRVNHAT